MNSLLKIVYKKKPFIITRKIIDEVVLIPISSGTKANKADNEIIILNNISSEIWGMINGQNTIEDTLNYITNNYKTTQSKVKMDIINCIQKFESLGIITKN